MEKIIEKGRKRTSTAASATEKSDTRIRNLFEKYANSELFDHDFNKMTSTERIKFVQEMAPYFLEKAKFENIERYDIDEKMYNIIKTMLTDYDKDGTVKVYRGDIKDVSEWYPL